MPFFSAASESAIRLLIYVFSQSKEGKKLGVPEIAKHTDTPVAYTAKIMQILSRKGLVYSSRGLHGGFYFDKHSPEIQLYNVIVAIDGIGFLEGCGLGLKTCSSQHPCPMHDEFSAIKNRLGTALKSTTISHLATIYTDKKAFLSLSELLS